MNSLIDALNQIIATPADTYEIKGDTFNLLRRLLVALWRGENIGNSPTVNRTSNGPAGILLNAKSPPPPGSIPPFPFQVVTRTDPSNPALSQASVYWNSSILINQVLNNNLAITGLADAPVSVGGSGNPNWFNFDLGNDLIWLEIVFGSGSSVAPTSAYINSWGMTSPPATNIWAPSDLPGEYGTGHGPFEYQLTFDVNSNRIYTQYIARIAILSSQTGLVGPPFPIYNNQLLSSNVMLEGDIYSGALFTPADGPATIPLVMPKPFAGPFISL